MNKTPPVLFSPIHFRSLKMRNRIMVSPMCQYSSLDGCVSDWHRAHLGQFVLGGAGFLMIEMTNVEPIGRISPYCVGLYDDSTERALTDLLKFCASIGDVPVGVQLAHAGRKASTEPPWKGRGPVPISQGGWQPVAPSAIPVSENDLMPQALNTGQVRCLVDKFAQSAERAQRIGFQAIELHAAHGYLLHQFLSPLTNNRDDQYGGTIQNRMRFPLEVFEAVREAFDQGLPVGVRVSAVDWAEGGLTIDDTVEFARQLKALGCDWVDVSSGGLVPTQRVATGPGYQVEFAKQVRDRADIPTIAVGMITDPIHAEEIIGSGSADVVALARGMLYNPRWVWHAADELDHEVSYPDQYSRCRLSARNTQ